MNPYTSNDRQLVSPYSDEHLNCECKIKKKYTNNRCRSVGGNRENFVPNCTLLATSTHTGIMAGKSKYVCTSKKEESSSDQEVGAQNRKTCGFLHHGGQRENKGGTMTQSC